MCVKEELVLFRTPTTDTDVVNPGPWMSLELRPSLYPVGRCRFLLGTDFTLCSAPPCAWDLLKLIARLGLCHPPWSS